MAEQPKETQLHRVERPHPTEIEDESGHLWAVSYADLLMVLLSFFVLFFSMEKNNKSEIMDNLTKFRAPSALEKEIKKDFSQSGWEAEPSKKSILTLSELKESLQNFPLEIQQIPILIQQTGSTLSFEMPKGIFEPGSTNLGTNGLLALDETLNRLKKYQTFINLSFIGHTDASPVSKNNSKIRFKDNLDLSVLRATGALRRAEHQGFLPSQLVAKGGGRYDRNARSLSIEIELQGQKP